MATKVMYDSAASSPKRLITVPQAPTPIYPIVATVSKFHSSGYAVWQLIGNFDISRRELALILGLCVVDETEQILPEHYMPRLAPMIQLRKDGQLRSARHWVLAPWAIDEAARIGGILEVEHGGYLQAIQAALNQSSTAPFVPLEQGEIWKDTSKVAVRIGPRPPAISVDISGSERQRWSLRWDQIARADYGRNRYLKQLSVEALGKRAEDIMCNVHVIDAQGLVSIDNTDPLSYYWLRLLAELDTELTMRFGPYPNGRAQLKVDFRRLPKSLGSSHLGNSLEVSPLAMTDTPLVKYGDKQHLEDALSKGLLRIAPASIYDDPSLNPSMRDNELVGEVLTDDSAPFNDLLMGIAPYSRPRRIIEARATSNYLVFCLSQVVARRLFLDFEKNYCLLIHNREEFLRRVNEAMAGQLPDWAAKSEEIEYYDPLMVNVAEVRMPFSKHFRYAYQSEFRLAWIPPTARRAIDYMNIGVSPLKDIAELVPLRTASGGRDAGHGQLASPG
jgi:hypothetical protein